MDIRPLRTEADYSAALEEIGRLLRHEPQPGTPEDDRLEVLSILVEAYENRSCPMPLPSPIGAIAY